MVVSDQQRRALLTLPNEVSPLQRFNYSHPVVLVTNKVRPFPPEARKAKDNEKKTVSGEFNGYNPDT